MKYNYVSYVFKLDAIMSLFVDKVFSEKGLNCRIKEEETFIWFKEFLVEIEGT